MIMDMNATSNTGLDEKFHQTVPFRAGTRMIREPAWTEDWSSRSAQQARCKTCMKNERIIFGAAYYEEYLPYDRLEQDMDLMVKAGLNTIRIAESTWSVEEPCPGEYDFSHVDRVIDAAAQHGIDVIVGTPTYAVPHWLVQMDPSVLVVTKDGPGRYGSRQNMDITNPTYLKYAEGIIHALVSHTADRPNVIGFQIDNETKHYGTAGSNVVARFRRWMAARFGTPEEMNRALGLNYWSCSVTSFDDLPEPTGTANGSYACEFAHFQQELAAEFLRWQASIVSKYKRPDQFITQNFDYEWSSIVPPGHQGGYSHGLQPDIDHFHAAEALTLIGTDIYCPSQDALTGMEIAFGGDEMRTLSHGANYLVLETQAQGIVDMLPYPGQLRLMAYSHLASGAMGVMYWGWSSIHNALETYFKGLLSHDFIPNPTYDEAVKVGHEWKALAPHLTGLTKKNRVGFVVSTDALTALRQFPTANNLTYNDVVLWLYRALYELNIECDVLHASEEDWRGYDLLLFPELYCASEALIARVREFIDYGGTVFATFRSFVADMHAKVYHDNLPHGLTDCFGMTYNQWTRPSAAAVGGAPAEHWIELLRPDTAETVASYEHKYWSLYAAVTRNDFGKGHAWYVGTMVDINILKLYVLRAARDAGVEIPVFRFPVVVRSGVNAAGKTLWFIMNYSDEPISVPAPQRGEDLLSGASYQPGDSISLADWGVCVLEVPK